MISEQMPRKEDKHRIENRSRRKGIATDQQGKMPQDFKNSKNNEGQQKTAEGTNAASEGNIMGYRKGPGNVLQ